MLAEAAKSSAAETAASEPLTREPIDEDTMEDGVVHQAEALEAGFLDEQADDATAIAGLTSDGEAIPSPFVALSLTFQS